MRYGLGNRRKVAIAVSALSLAAAAALFASAAEPETVGAPLLSTSSILAMIVTSIFSGGMGLRLLDHYTGRGERKRGEQQQALDAWKDIAARSDALASTLQAQLAAESERRQAAIEKLAKVEAGFRNSIEEVEHLTIDVARLQAIIDSQLRILSAAQQAPRGSAP